MIPVVKRSDDEMSGAELLGVALELTEESVTALVSRATDQAGVEEAIAVLRSAISEADAVALGGGGFEHSVVKRIAAKALLRAASEVIASDGLITAASVPDLVAGRQMLITGDLDSVRALINRLASELTFTDRSHWNHGNLVHDLNVLRGFLYLDEGRLQESANALVEASTTPGSPQLDSFGPDLSLAWALLAKGQDEAVLTYLREVSRFWSPDVGTAFQAADPS